MSPTLTLATLGILQGLTEFLPVSSSGHLVLVQSWLPSFQEPGVLFHATVHLATLGAVLLYFRRDVVVLACAALRPRASDPDAVRLLGLVVAGTLPTALIGLLFKDGLERLFSSVPTAASMLLVTGALLVATDRVRGQGADIERMRVWHALLIGLVQGMAIIPGVSRSGATVAAGVLSGLGRDLALRYSFLLSIPAILGAFTLQLLSHGLAGAPDINGFGYAAAFLAAFVTGYLGIEVLLRVLLSRRLGWFALYCWGLGLTVLITRSLSG
ncbi:MAG: undecaprenyl-diphosphate phosphatase [Deltaproteobacteria bacterium]|nr:undecaprenyl-diphosphate phosphatase [Deltaproteobacteria bacterium]